MRGHGYAGYRWVWYRVYHWVWMDVKVHERVCNSCYVHQLEQFIKIPYIGHREGKECLMRLSGETLYKTQ